MALSINQKQKIRVEAQRFVNRFSTRYQGACQLRISVPEYTEAIQGENLETLTDAKWTSIAQLLGVNLKETVKHKTAMTKTVIYLIKQFEICHKSKTGGLFCDITDIGKTEAAKYYAENTPGAYRIDCSIFKSKRRLINEIARQLNVPKKRNYWETYDALVWEINNSDQDLFFILDEYGDLQYDAFLEVKGLWNATEGNCGWFQLGADALKQKIERGKECQIVGYHENFSRSGGKYQKCIREDAEGREEDLLTQAALVAKLNAPPGADVQRMVLESGGSLRSVIKLINKETYNRTSEA